MNITLKLRKWQSEAIERSKRSTYGIFLEALGGRGKTICALAIAKKKTLKKSSSQTTVFRFLKDGRKQSKR
jgi:hypothetical protein